MAGHPQSAPFFWRSDIPSFSRSFCYFSPFLAVSQYFCCTFAQNNNKLQENGNRDYIDGRPSLQVNFTWVITSALCSAEYNFRTLATSTGCSFSWLMFRLWLIMPTILRRFDRTSQGGSWLSLCGPRPTEVYTLYPEYDSRVGWVDYLSDEPHQRISCSA